MAAAIRGGYMPGRRVGEPRRRKAVQGDAVAAGSDEAALRRLACMPGPGRRSRLAALAGLAAIHLHPAGAEQAGCHAMARWKAEVAALAEGFLDRGMVERPPPGLFAAGVAVAAAARALEGRSFHVVSLDDSAPALAARAAPLLDALEVGWRMIGADPASSTGPDAFGQRVLFVRIRELTLAHMRDKRVLRMAAGSGVRANVAHLCALAGSARPAIRFPLDTALFVDAEQSLAEASMMAVVATGIGDGVPSDTAFASEAIGVAGQLSAAGDYRHSAGRILLTRQGRTRLAGLCRCLGPGWEEPARAELAVIAALEARELWQRDRDYRLVEGRVEPVSERLAARERSAPAGLGPMLAIAAAEGIALPGEAGMRERMTLRSMALAYPHRAAAVAGLDRYAEELARAYGLRRLGRPPRPVRLYADEVSAARRIRGGPGTVVLLVGGTEERAREAAAALSDRADRDLFATLRRMAEAEGVVPIERCLWWPDASAGCQFLREQAPRLGRIEAVVLGTSALPAIADLSQARFGVLANALTAPARQGRLVRCAAWFAARLLPVRPLAQWVWRRCMMEDGRPGANLRSRLHEFDRHCRRAASFLSPAGRME